MLSYSDIYRQANLAYQYYSITEDDSGLQKKLTSIENLENEYFSKEKFYRRYLARMISSYLDRYWLFTPTSTKLIRLFTEQLQTIEVQSKRSQNKSRVDRISRECIVTLNFEHLLLPDKYMHKRLERSKHIEAYKSDLNYLMDYYAHPYLGRPKPLCVVIPDRIYWFGISLQYYCVNLLSQEYLFSDIYWEPNQVGRIPYVEPKENSSITRYLKRLHKKSIVPRLLKDENLKSSFFEWCNSD